MEVKGTALKTTFDFIKTKFPTSVNAWLDSLPPESKEIYKKPLDVSQWYPMKAGYLDPIDKVVEMFFEGDAKAGGEALGIYSADIALKGIYKVFLLISSPNYLMSRASVILATFYKPSEIKIAESAAKTVTLQLTKFPEITEALEYRIAGWCLRALELTNSKNCAYQITESLARGGDKTTIVFTWS